MTKHQTDCYRTFNGVRWINWTDILEESDAGMVVGAQKSGIRIKVRGHPQGFSQAFLHPNDVERAKVFWNFDGVLRL